MNGQQGIFWLVSPSHGLMVIAHSDKPSLGGLNTRPFTQCKGEGKESSLCCITTPVWQPLTSDRIEGVVAAAIPLSPIIERWPQSVHVYPRISATGSLKALRCQDRLTRYLLATVYSSPGHRTSLQAKWYHSNKSCREKLIQIQVIFFGLAKAPFFQPSPALNEIKWSYYLSGGGSRETLTGRNKNPKLAKVAQMRRSRTFSDFLCSFCFTVHQRVAQVD